jgi:HD superfamily phosphodiesterase
MPVVDFTSEQYSHQIKRSLKDSEIRRGDMYAAQKQLNEKDVNAIARMSFVIAALSAAMASQASMLAFGLKLI